jgi:hypothetical protein
MNRLKEISLSLIVLLIFVFAPTISHAQLNSILVGEAAINQEIGAGIDAFIGTDSGINTATDLQTDLNVDTNVEADTDVILEENIFDENTEKDSNSDSSFSLKVNSSGVAVLSSSQVNTESDLDVFSSNVSTKEKEVANINIHSKQEGESEVKVVYRHKGKLLGFIPVAINSTTIVGTKTDAEEAKVRSKLSWWSFLVTNENYVKSEVESRIKNNDTIKTNARVDSSAQAKAQIAEVVIAEMAAHADAQASINR